MQIASRSLNACFSLWKSKYYIKASSLTSPCWPLLLICQKLIKTCILRAFSSHVSVTLVDTFEECLVFGLSQCVFYHRLCLFLFSPLNFVDFFNVNNLVFRALFLTLLLFLSSWCADHSLRLNRRAVRARLLLQRWIANASLSQINRQALDALRFWTYNATYSRKLFNILRVTLSLRRSFFYRPGNTSWFMWIHSKPVVFRFPSSKLFEAD